MQAKRVKGFILLGIISILTFSSCRSKKEVVRTGGCTVPVRTTPELLDSLKKKQFDFNTLSAKFDAEVALDGTKNSFTVNSRMLKDSVIWMSISVLGINMARAIVTKDSVKFINNHTNTYFTGDFAYVSKLLQSDLDFEMIQSLLVGNNVDFYDDPEKLHTSTRDCKYLLSTVRKRRLLRRAEKNKDLKEPVQSIYLEPNTFKISRIFFNEVNTNRTFDAAFDKFNETQGILFPHKIKYDIKAEKNVLIFIEYDKITLGKTQTYPFSIPSKYEKITYKEKQ